MFFTMSTEKFLYRPGFISPYVNVQNSQIWIHTLIMITVFLTYNLCKETCLQVQRSNHRKNYNCVLCYEDHYMYFVKRLWI